jgi:hypothetical protein
LLRAALAAFFPVASRKVPFNTTFAICKTFINN